MTETDGSMAASTPRRAVQEGAPRAAPRFTARPPRAKDRRGIDTRAKAMKLVHVVPNLALGGGALALLNAARYFARAGADQAVLVLDRFASDLFAQVEAIGVSVIGADRSDADAALAGCDAILVHFWQTARMHLFLRGGLPPARVAICAHVLGATPAQILTPAILDTADLLIATSPATLRLPAVAGRAIAKIHVASTGAFTGIGPRGPEPAGPVTVGYLGLVDFVKLHRDFVAMTAAVPRAIVAEVCGVGAAYPVLQAEAVRLGAADRFRWRGHVPDVAAAFAGMHVFGYPLAEDTYATSERVLQEAMYAGLPPVVFDRPGYRDYVRPGENALVAGDPAGYVEAVTALCDDPALRRRIGAAAHASIARDLDPDRHGARLVRAVEDLVRDTPKRARTALPPAHDRFEAAGLFAATLADAADSFRISLDGAPGPARDAAEEEIARSPEALRNPGAGGMFDYRAVFPGDAMLAFWCGLSELHRGAAANALAHLLVARRAGLAADRVDPWMRAAHASLGRRRDRGAGVP